jgi:hypothetical protein
MCSVVYTMLLSVATNDMKILQPDRRRPLIPSVVWFSPNRRDFWYQWRLPRQVMWDLGTGESRDERGVEVRRSVEATTVYPYPFTWSASSIMIHLWDRSIKNARLLSQNVQDKGEDRRHKQGHEHALHGIAYHVMPRFIPGGDRKPVKGLASNGPCCSNQNTTLLAACRAKHVVVLPNLHKGRASHRIDKDDPTHVKWSC